MNPLSGVDFSGIGADEGIYPVFGPTAFQDLIRSSVTPFSPTVKLDFERAADAATDLTNAMALNPYFYDANKIQPTIDYSRSGTPKFISIEKTPEIDLNAIKAEEADYNRRKGITTSQATAAEATSVFDNLFGKSSKSTKSADVTTPVMSRRVIVSATPISVKSVTGIPIVDAIIGDVKSVVTGTQSPATVQNVRPLVQQRIQPARQSTWSSDFNTVVNSILQIATPFVAAKQANQKQRFSQATQSATTDQSTRATSSSTYLIIGGGVLAAGLLAYMAMKD